MLLSRRPQEMFSTTLFDNFLNDDWVKSFYKRVVATPSINVIETANEYDMEMAVPGLTKEDLNVQIDEIIIVCALKEDIAFDFFEL